MVETKKTLDSTYREAKSLKMLSFKAFVALLPVFLGKVLDSGKLKIQRTVNVL